MGSRISNTEMAYFAKVVWSLAGSQSGEAQTALAWLIVNRMKLAGDERSGFRVTRARQVDGNLAAACKSVLSDAASSDNKLPPCAVGFEDPGYCQAFSVVCRVWSGDQADPTGGAVDFHDHRKSPAWAHKRTPNALIGRYFYYP